MCQTSPRKASQAAGPCEWGRFQPRSAAPAARPTAHCARSPRKRGRAPWEARGLDQTREGGRRPRSHSESGVQVRLPSQAHAQQPHALPARKPVSQGWSALPRPAWCQLPPGPGLMGQECSVLMGGHQRLDGRQPAPCPPVLTGRQAGLPQARQGADRPSAISLVHLLP